MVIPSSPSSSVTRFHAPTVFWEASIYESELRNAWKLTKCLSFAHGPIGSRNLSWQMSSNPASFIHPSILWPGSGSLPQELQAPHPMLFHLCSACSGVSDPSSE